MMLHAHLALLTFGLIDAPGGEDEETDCTGDTATWCPVHGDCTCPYLHDIPDNGRTFDSETRPLHAPNSEHGGTTS